MKIYHGDFEVYESGVITSSDLSDTRFVLSETPHMEIVFRISIEGKETGIKVEALSDTTLALIFTNPSTLGFGPAQPVKVGQLHGKDLYVAFRVSMRGLNESYGLEYTFYVKENG